MSWLNRIKQGLSKTSSNISTGISDIFTKQKLNEDTLLELEELLISADIGPSASSNIVKNFAKDKFNKEITSQEIKEYLAENIENLLKNSLYDLKKIDKTKVIIICGVNGNGKTTTIGKLTSMFKNSNKSVMLAAADTFRAAAKEQLKIWANRTKVEMIEGEDNADPASVAYRAYSQASAKKIDILMIDTAGRLQNQLNLMEELSKISRVLKKIDLEAPHEVFLILDATTGQNALSQIEKFKEAIDINAIIVTKLDGTAKGGMLISLYEKYKIPIYAIGIGEQIDDLQIFDPKVFAKNLVGL